MNYIRIILLSLSIAIVWGLFFIDAYQVGTVGYILAFLFSFYGCYFVRQEQERDRFSALELFLLLVFPTLYLIAYLIVQNSWSTYTLFNPLLSALIIMVLGTRLINIRKQKSLQFFTIFYILVYCLSLIFYHQKSPRGTTETYDFSLDRIENNIAVSQIDKEVNIDQFYFQGIDRTVNTIVSNNKPIILETWHEKCSPCLNAINDTQEFFKEQDDKLGHYYVYNPRGNFDLNKVFGFEKITDPTKIYIWESKNDRIGISINADPTFLYFDKEGFLIDTKVGYSRSKQYKFKEEILEFIKSQG